MRKNCYGCKNYGPRPVWRNGCEFVMSPWCKLLHIHIENVSVSECGKLKKVIEKEVSRGQNL
jgi:hypothetical protein